jgi:flavin-dependent dehydrogenase
VAGRIQSVAVIGGGPAGSTVAALLAKRGIRVGLFSRGRPKPPLIGESTVPALVPILRELGVEEEVASYSVFKPGATFTVQSGERLEIDFDEVHGRVPGYAYNVPRDRFDASLLDVCAKNGAQIFEATARLERVPGGDARSDHVPGSDARPERSRLRLSSETLAQTDGFFATTPDFIIDATGRTRLIPRLLDLPEKAGDRRDTALFAHCTGVRIDSQGHVHTDRLERGWCWRIPLGDRVSVGVVVEPTALQKFGDRPDEQFDAICRSDPQLANKTVGAERVTPVLKFTNYQLATQQGIGPGWALVGDCLGFIDPVFSSGVFLAMDGAKKLADALLAGSPRALERYDRHQRRHIEAWRQAVDYFYDGRFVAMLRLRNQPHENWIGRIVSPHAAKHLPRVFTGESTARLYERSLLAVMMKYGLYALEDPDWARWRID